VNFENCNFYLLAPDDLDFTHIIALYKSRKALLASDHQEMSGEVK